MMISIKEQRVIKAFWSRRCEFLLPVIFIACAAFSLWEARNMSQLGAVFPVVISAVIMVAGIARLIQLSLHSVMTTSPSSRGSTPRRAMLVVVMLGWAVTLPWLGFLVSSLVSFVALMLIAQYQRWYPRRLAGHLLVGACLVGCFYALFALLLNVPLPSGTWLVG